MLFFCIEVFFLRITLYLKIVNKDILSSNTLLFVYFDVLIILRIQYNLKIIIVQ